MLGDTPLDNPRHEAYARARTEGLTQRQAMIKAFPARVAWKPATLDRKASILEKRPEVKARIRALKRDVAKELTISKAEVISGMSETFLASLKTLRVATQTSDVDQAALNGISSLGRLLLQALPDEEQVEEASFERDFGLLIAEPFFALHRRVAKDGGGDFWTYGGRSSTKSSCISLEIVAGLMKHQKRSAFIMVKRKTDIREGVFEQMLWALKMLGVEEEFECTVSPLKMVRKQTGQVILFRGGDNTEKTKSVKAPAGTYFAYLWVEEADQFGGMAELRTIYQSVTRDAGQDAVYFRFHSFNPPRSKTSWANQKIVDLTSQGIPVYKANYCDVPPEWIPEQTRLDAERLRIEDPESFAHEYMGEPVGFGSEVFTRVEVRTITLEERSNLEYHYYGIDWGFSQDPFAWVKIGYDEKTRTLFILDEIVSKGLSNAEAAERVEKRMGRALKLEDTIIEDAEPYAIIWADSAEPKSIADFRELGINAKACSKTGVHNVRNSIKWLQCRSRIVIDPTCTTAAREFSSYSYEITKDGEVTGLLPDRDNHTIDAVRYACTTLITDRSLT